MDEEDVASRCMLCGRILKWIPVVVVAAVLAWSYYAYVIQLCIVFTETLVQQVIYLVLYHALLVMLSWSYWRTIFSPVGTVPNQFRLSAADLERFGQTEEQFGPEARRQILESLAKSLSVLTRTSDGPSYCTKCDHLKPDRCHHCRFCGVCVTKMDHHCPWVNNCVGFSNYKFFVLFLGYTFTDCIFIAATSLPYLIEFWKTSNGLPGSGGIHIAALFFVSIGFSIPLGLLWGYHIHLVLHNRSTLESSRPPIFLSGPDKNGFNLGKYQNFIEVFGESKLCWFLPIFTSLGDGLAFKTRNPQEAPVVAPTSPVSGPSADANPHHVVNVDPAE